MNVSYVCKIGNTTADKQNFAFRAEWSAEHKVQNSASVVICLGLCGSTGIFSVVGKLVGIAGRSNSISVDDRGTTSSNQSPNATL